MICKTPTKKFPNGRTGTTAGYRAHKDNKEPICEACAKANKEYNKKYQKENKERIRAKRKEWKERNWESYTANNRRYYQENAEVIKKRANNWHHANKEKANAYSREYRRRNPERVKEAIKAWHEENSEYVKEQQKLWREANREKSIVYFKKYYKDNKEKFLAYGAKRRALFKEIPNDKSSIEDIAIEHGTICYLCNHEVDLRKGRGTDDCASVDHVIPITALDTPGHVLDNLRITHLICNLRKTDKPVETLNLPFEPPTGEAWSII